MTDRICSIKECNQPLHARGWCSRHYSAWRHKGDPLAEVVRHYTTPPQPKPSLPGLRKKATASSGPDFGRTSGMD